MTSECSLIFSDGIEHKGSLLGSIRSRKTGHCVLTVADAGAC
jgi:hypothetical protein